jgi:translation elongation factor EF-4
MGGHQLTTVDNIQSPSSRADTQQNLIALTLQALFDRQNNIIAKVSIVQTSHSLTVTVKIMTNASYPSELSVICTKICDESTLSASKVLLILFVILQACKNDPALAMTKWARVRNHTEIS